MWGVSAAVKKNERANRLCQQKSERNHVGVFTHTKPVGIMRTGNCSVCRCICCAGCKNTGIRKAEDFRVTIEIQTGMEIDMLNQFSRTQLLLGAENMDRLAKAKVAIFGIGGVGGYVAEAVLGAADADGEAAVLRQLPVFFLAADAVWSVSEMGEINEKRHSDRRMNPVGVPNFFTDKHAEKVG